MENFKTIPIKKEDDGQIIIPFGEKEIQKSIYEEELSEVIKIVQDLNKKYPYARLNSSLVKPDGNGGFLFENKPITLEDLEDEVILMNEAYNPNTDSRKDK